MATNGVGLYAIQNGINFDIITGNGTNVGSAETLRYKVYQ